MLHVEVLSYFYFFLKITGSLGCDYVVIFQIYWENSCEILFFYYLNQGIVFLNSAEIFCVKQKFYYYLVLIFLLNVTSFCSGLCLFLGFLSLRNMFLLLGILTWLSVRVPRGSFGYLSQVFDRKKGVQSTEAQRIAGDREFPMALFPPSHINTLFVRTLNFSLSLLEKDTSKAWM